MATSVLLLGSAAAPTAGAAVDDPFSVTGQVFVDFDRDGMIDDGESGRDITAGLTVVVDDDGGRTMATTLDDGTFLVTLPSPPSGLLRIEFETPFNHRSTFVRPFGDRAVDTGAAVQYIEANESPVVANYGIVPRSKCPDSPTSVSGPSGAFPDGNPNSLSGKVWSSCFVDGAARNDDGANDVLIAANYDAEGWNPSDAETGFGGNLDLEHLATRSEMGAIWGVAYDEWDGVLYASAVIKRHSGLGPEGVDGLYWRWTDDARVPGPIRSVGLDALSPPGAPTYGAEPPVCPGDGDEYPGFDLSATAPGERWDCRDVNRAEAGEESHDWWAYDRTGRDGIGDIDVTPDGERLLVTNATAEAVFVYDIATDGAPTYFAHHPIADPGCRGGGFEAWGVTATDSVTALVGVTCTGSESNLEADVVSHVVRLDIASGAQSSIVDVAHDYPHAPGFTDGALPGAGQFRPWIGRGIDGSLELPPVAEAASVDFRDFLDAYAYSNGWEWHQPLLSGIALDPFDGSLVLGVMDRWSMMTGVFNCGLVPNDNGCGVELPSPPPGDYDGVPGDDPVAGYTAGIVGYVAGDLLRVCNTDPTARSVLDATFVVEGGDGCDPSEFSPAHPADTGGGPSGPYEWYWNDQAFESASLTSAHPEAAQGAVFIADRNENVVYTAMNPVETFGAGLSTDSNRDGSHEQGLQFFRTDFRNQDGTGWKSAGVGDVDGCSIPLEIGGFVWFDDDADGVRDAEVGLAGVRVSLVDRDSGVVVEARKTAEDGSYFFDTADGLRPNADYTMRFDATEIEGLRELVGIESLADLAVTRTDRDVDRPDIDSDVQFDEISRRPALVFSTRGPGDNDHSLSAGFARRAEVGGFGLDGSSGGPGATDERPKQGPPPLRVWLIALGVFAGFLVVAGVFFRWLWSRPA